MGRGEFALIAWCRVPTITLYLEIEDAVKEKAMIDSTGCGGACSRRHEIIHIDLSGIGRTADRHSEAALPERTRSSTTEQNLSAPRSPHRGSGSKEHSEGAPQ